MDANRQAIAFNKKLTSLKVELRSLEKELAKIAKAIRRVEHQIAVGSEVTEVFQGIALHRYSDTFTTCADQGNTRGGAFYKLANNPGYGVRTWEDTCGCRGEQTVFSPGFKTQDEAIAQIKRWIADGVRPRT